MFEPVSLVAEVWQVVLAHTLYRGSVAHVFVIPLTHDLRLMTRDLPIDCQLCIDSQDCGYDAVGLISVQ